MSKVVVVLMTILLVSCRQRDGQDGDMMEDRTLGEDIALIQQKRVYFGHQSVGQNIVDGLTDILVEMRGVRMDVLSLHDAREIPASFFAHSAIGENGNPQAKCSDFSQIIVQKMGGRIDVALMKFCYVDITPDTDVARVFELYRTTLDTLKKVCPRVIFLHVTVPLTSPTRQWKRVLNGILGRVGNNDLSNIKRCQFNEMLLQYFKGDMVFDLATLESSYRDGRRESFEHKGRTYYSLIDSYTEDGGHLNKSERRRAAALLLHTLAAAVRRSATEPTAGISP